MQALETQQRIRWNDTPTAVFELATLDSFRKQLRPQIPGRTARYSDYAKFFTMLGYLSIVGLCGHYYSRV